MLCVTTDVHNLCIDVCHHIENHLDQLLGENHSCTLENR